ncbi:TPA: flagellar biosynthetic protein FliO [Klebsiella aerogenes]|uniref:flagellar biosynthetic protein FliO n=1 Tax=Klebsiella aerogenes TaxID=548 RepID=UPI0027F22881|nr:flagellar biosynthetic protein FliO [Klebsiella aerogenes]ELA2594377.1 flagellar biosynthetic protein FliO [Klebsiella aerogenes]EMF0786568.1 flagellar biosynthetic protein FliO [Klebsiella aerogenes]
MTAPVTMQASQPVTEPAVSGGSALMQVSSALGAILLLILLAGWLFRRLGFAPQARNGRLLHLRASCQVGQRERVVVVEVDNTLLVLGVTAQQITPLHQFPAPPRDENTPAVTPANDFRQLMQNVLKRPEK